MTSSRTERLERRLHAAFELSWGEDIPASMNALNRRSRSHFWTTNNAYMLQCLEALASIGGAYNGPIRPCFICTLSSTSCTLPWTLYVSSVHRQHDHARCFINIASSVSLL